MRKKAFAILLLLIVAMFTLRPAIAMHFCMGEVHSFQFYQHQVTCKEHAPSAPASIQMYTLESKSCCNDTFLELTTDAYENHTKLSVARSHPSPVSESLFLVTYVYKQPIQEIELAPFPDEFPPGGRFLKDLDILVYICIYRI